MNPREELPLRVVGRRNKTVYERFEEIQRHGRLFRHRRQARIQVQQPDGAWVPYVRRKSARAS